MFKRTAIILAAMAFSVANAFAVAVDNCGQEFAYTSGLTLTCGDKTFSDFSITGNINDATIRLSNLGDIAINFGGSFYADSLTGPQDYQIFYSVATDGNWLISEIGQAFNASYGGAGGFVIIGEVVRSGSFAGPSVAQSNLSWTNNTNCTDVGNDCEDPAIEGDQLVLTPSPLQKVYVTKDIQLIPMPCSTDQRCYNYIGATIITQTFKQIPDGDIPDVPEPTTMLLFSTALLGLGFMRRKKS